MQAEHLKSLVKKQKYTNSSPEIEDLGKSVINFLIKKAAICKVKNYDKVKNIGPDFSSYLSDLFKMDGPEKLSERDIQKALGLLAKEKKFYQSLEKIEEQIADKMKIKEHDSKLLIQILQSSQNQKSILNLNSSSAAGIHSLTSSNPMRNFSSSNSPSFTLDSLYQDEFGLENEQPEFDVEQENQIKDNLFSTLSDLSSLLIAPDQKINTYLRKLKVAQSQLSYLTQKFNGIIKIGQWIQQGDGTNFFQSNTLTYNFGGEEEFFSSSKVGKNKKQAREKVAFDLLQQIYSNHPEIWQEMKNWKIKKNIKN